MFRLFLCFLILGILASIAEASGYQKNKFIEEVKKRTPDSEVLKGNHEKILSIMEEIKGENARMKTENENLKNELSEIKKIMTETNNKQDKANEKIIHDLKIVMNNVKKEVNEKIISENDLIEVEISKIKDINGVIRNQNLKTEEELSEVKDLILHFKKDLTSSRDCYELKERGITISGIHTVYPFNDYSKSIEVLCDQKTENGGWTLIQKRDNIEIRENFTRNWSDYSNGFGNYLNGEFWLGLETVHILTQSVPMELRIDLTNSEGVRKYAKYDSFSVGSESEYYKLAIGSYSGDAGNSLKYHNSINFSTFDKDNDSVETIHCAKDFQGGWWFKACYVSFLNGLPIVGNHSSDHGIHWQKFGNYNDSMAQTIMMIRPKI